MPRCCSPGRAQALRPPAKARSRARRSWFSSFGLLQLQRAGSLHPLAAAVLYQLLESDLGLVDGGDDAEVLSQVVASFHPVEVRSRLHQAEGLLLLADAADHLDRLGRVGPPLRQGTAPPAQARAAPLEPLPPSAAPICATTPSDCASSERERGPA